MPEIGTGGLRFKSRHGISLRPTRQSLPPVWL